MIPRNLLFSGIGVLLVLISFGLAARAIYNAGWHARDVLAAQEKMETFTANKEVVDDAVTKLSFDIGVNESRIQNLDTVLQEIDTYETASDDPAMCGIGVDGLLRLEAIR